MPDLGDLVATGQQDRVLVSAEVVSVGATLRVKVPSFSEELDTEVQHWDGNPVVGDEVLIAYDEQGDEWVVAGITGPPGPAGPTGETGPAGPAGPAGSFSSFEDTQSSNLTSNGAVVTGISITPGAGTYFAIASVNASTSGTGSIGAISLRVNGSNVITGPSVQVPGSMNAAPFVAGIITPTAGQAVEVWWAYSFGSNVTVASGRLTLLKIG